MFEYQQNLQLRAKLQEARKKRKKALRDRIAAAKTLKKLRSVLIEALEEGTL